MATIEVVTATLEHARRMASRTRRADREEVWASHGVGAREALALSLMASREAWTGLVNGEPACMFGVTPYPAEKGVGVPWMIGTDLVERHAAAFLRRNRSYVRHMLGVFPKLRNHVDARNEMSIRWLRWLGFTIHAAAPYGLYGLPFHLFTMESAR